MSASSVTVLKTSKHHAADQASARDAIDGILEELRLIAFAVSGLAHECCADAGSADGVVNRIYEVIDRVRVVGEQLSPIDSTATMANVERLRS
jgi:hypothetical protein